MSVFLNKDNLALYEQTAHWGRAYDAWFYEKKRIFQALVSPDVRTILDVGCGDGEITNDFCPDRVVVGLDRSDAALAHVTRRKVKASCDDIPFKDRSFDFVLCSEVLEHLPGPVYYRTVRELARVCAKYLVLSVPYRQVLSQGVTCCASCGTKYNIDGHLRSFRHPADVSRHFPQFKNTFVGYCGGVHGRPLSWMIQLRRLFLGDWAVHEIAVCPTCGSKCIARSQKQKVWLKWFLDRVQWRLLSAPVHRWMVVKLERTDK